MVYRQLSFSAPNQRFALSVSGNDFFVRQIKLGENYASPISESNLMQGVYFLGRSRVFEVSIKGFSVSESIPDPAIPNVDAQNVDMKKDGVNGLINFGPQMIEPGTFSWDGDRFQARPSATARQFRPDISVLEGRAIVKSNMVVELDCDRVGMFAYRYDETRKLPPGDSVSGAIWQRGKMGTHV